MLSIIKVPNHIAGFGTVILRDLFSIYIQSIPIFRLEFLFKSLKFLMKSLLHRFFRVIAAHHPVHTLGIDFGNAELTICFLHCLLRRVVKFKDIYIIRVAVVDTMMNYEKYWNLFIIFSSTHEMHF